VDELPAHIGPYEVRDRLGHGGMGVVYLGFDPMLDRPVAIKVLKVPDDETRRRFLREARLAAKVHHPHIVSIYAVGEHEGNPYLAMEFIAGRTMAQVIRGGDQVPLARKVHWLSELCAGLGHAHDSGIVHRDVKPSNLLIAQSTGTLRLVDFGIAHGNEASSMTMAGMIVGTPQYMSPEQITGQPVDARSDIFSVGAVAYELLTGRQAFGGDNLYHVSRQIVGEQPRPIESFVPDVPQALVKTIAKCLQKDPAARAETAKLLEREFLAIARRLDPEHTLVVLPAEPTMVAPSKDVTTSRREMLREAEEAIEQGQLTTASGLLQKLESGTSPNPDVQQLRHKLQGRRLELRLHEAVGKADEASQTGSVEEAEAAINALAEIAPRHPALERLRKAHQERLDERQLATLVSRARQALQQDRLDEAETLIAEALALSPDSSDALAVQQKLSERTRAQRIARLVAQASRALDQDDTTAARRAIDALVKVDAGHRDVARLQARLASMTSESAEHALRAAPAAPAVGQAAAAAAASATAPARAPAAAPPPPVATPQVATPAAAPARSVEPPAAPKPPSAVPPRVADHGSPSPPVDGLLLRQPSPGEADETRPAAPPTSETTDAAPTRSPLMPALALLALLVIAGGSYYAFVGGSSSSRTGSSGPSRPGRPQEPEPAKGNLQPGAPSSMVARNEPPTGGPASMAALNEPPAVTTPPTALGSDPAASASVTTPTPAMPAGTATARTDPWVAARQHAAAGRFDRALAAIDQVKGAPAADAQQERGRVAENARRHTLAARRGAEDLRQTQSPEYVLGMSKQAQADRDRSAGRLHQAVNGYLDARSHFLQAMNTGNGAANPAPVPPASPAEAPKKDPAGPTTAPETPPKPSVDLSTWSNDEAHAALSQFCGAYRGRDIGGLTRLWPNMEPAWRAEFREAFETEGELVCVFENVTLFRTSDEFSGTAQLLTQLPGSALRRRRLAVTLVPARDRIVIGNLRAR
jgi:serine/threonine protein kinase